MSVEVRVLLGVPLTVRPTKCSSLLHVGTFTSESQRVHGATRPVPHHAMTDDQRTILTNLGFVQTPKYQPGTRLSTTDSGSAWENWELHKPGARTLYIGHRTNHNSRDGITEPYWANIFELNRPPLRMHTFDDMLAAVVALRLDPHIRDVANCYIYE